ncbi:MAG: alcohol dehydrogenase catalytic domain-containing protein [Clostridia bacterium]|nr:alcohol dehydrogenase catalytic domain-containing protein [Clostridia bacterium]
MEKTMKGLMKQFPETGATFRVDLPIPEPADNEILVKVHFAAICGTDQHIYEWNEWAQERVPLPMVFGHEFSGEIIKVGSGVTAFRAGDRIAAETHIPCNNCYQCRTGNMHNCENMKIIGVHVAGGFSDYAVIPQDCAWKLDDFISYRHAAMLEPMGVAVHGVMSDDINLKSVVILGCGPIGVMAAGVAAAAGAAQVIAVDVFDNKLAMAKKVGANICINTKTQDFIDVILKETNGQGADVIVDYTGAVGLIEVAFKALKKGGRFTFVGLPNKKLSLDLTSAVIYKEARMNGVTGRLMYKTWYQCMDILRQGTFTLDDVIGGIYGLEDYEKAFQDIRSGIPGKMLFDLE